MIATSPGAASPFTISLPEWRAGGGTFTYRGHEIFTRRGGATDAPVLLLIHGFPSASWDFEALWPALAARYRVLTLDLIGFGFSAKPADYDYRIHDQADLCEAFLRAEGVRDYHVLAHDYGVSVAQELLARQAEAAHAPRLGSVALLNGGLFPETHRALLIQKLMLSPLGPLLARLGNRRSLSRSFRYVFGAHTQPSPALLENFWTLLMHNDGRRVLPRLIRYILDRREHRERWVSALVRTTVPLRVINGAADPVSGAHMVARYRELVPQPDVVSLEGIGHYPQCEAPTAVLQAYLAFRDGLAPGREHLPAGR
ncbi:MAG: alpha/beta hydrolase [Moraxellaceae bacterium]|jgi:pimeloyl-ACP methyl ester carboxylesterase|nr:alpha/beta hydrolase [Moraxellaceae bacterium]